VKIRKDVFVARVKVRKVVRIGLKASGIIQWV